MNYKLRSKRQVAPRKKTTEESSKKVTVAERWRSGHELLMEAERYYSAMSRFRQERERNKRYTYGDQWGDRVCVEGKVMTEEEYIKSQGNLPLANNLIRRLVRNVIGVWRNQATEPTCVARDREEQQLGETMSTVLQYVMQLNCMTEVYARTMEEFLISGFIVHRKWYGRKGEKEDCWTEMVQPNNFFVDNCMRDCRGWDCSMVGEIHDVSWGELSSEFAESPEDYMRLQEIYRVARDGVQLRQVWDSFGYPERGLDKDFYTAQDEGLYRVIEIWRKESKPRYWCHDYNSGEVFKVEKEDYREMVEEENARRLAQGLVAGMAEEDIPLIEARWYIDNYWRNYYLAPTGEILRERDTPYAHKSHPYVFKAYPMIDGEIHSFVADVVDQQRYTNRLITLYDWIMRASAKGVLMIPSDSIPKGMGPEDFADMWARHDGVIVYTPSKSQQVPQQVYANSTNIGIQELLNLQLKFFEDISGVNGALQGKPGYSGMSAALYSQQTQNATTSLLDLLDSFSEFVRSAAYKDVKNIQQYYDRKRVMEIAGEKCAELGQDAERIRDVEFDLSVVQSTATPSYRAMANNFLMELWHAQAITLEELLETGSFPFADGLLQSLKARQAAQAQAAQAQGAQGAPEQVEAEGVNEGVR